MPTPPDDQTRAWVAAWKERGKALEEARKQELRALTEEEAGRIFAEMTVDPETMWVSPERANSVGFIEQQRLFMLSPELDFIHFQGRSLLGTNLRKGIFACRCAEGDVQKLPLTLAEALTLPLKSGFAKWIKSS